MPPSGRYVTRAALAIQASKYSADTISPFDRDKPMFNRLIIDLINRLHRDRNKLFHRLTNEKYRYYCVNRTWYHYYEWMYHCNLDTDILHGTVGDVPVTICDLYLRDKHYISGVITRENTRGFFDGGPRQIRDMIWKMEGMKHRSCSLSANIRTKIF